VVTPKTTTPVNQTRSVPKTVTSARSTTARSPRRSPQSIRRPGWSGAAAGTHQVWEAGRAVPLGRDGPLIQDAPTDARSYIRHADARKDEM